MEKYNLLIEMNNTRKMKLDIYKGSVYYKNEYSIFNGQTIKNIINFINTVQDKYKKVKIPIVIDIGLVRVEDKLSYIILECICYYLIKMCNRKVYLSFEINKTIWTEGITSSPLTLLTTGEDNHIDKFISQFNKEIYLRHYRKVITNIDRQDLAFPSKIMAEIDSFLKPFNVEKSCRNALSEVVTELADNVNEHTNGDCLIDIDVSNTYNKDNDSGLYYGLNVVVLNISDKLFGDALKTKLLHKDILTNRYNMVNTAYINHSKHFDEEVYRSQDFFNIASFQHKISGRDNNKTTGGTGLTKLIHSLEKTSDSNKCYMISGNRCVYFSQEHLIFNEDGWIGFNSNNNFIDNIPDEGIVGGSYIHLPGTAFNLNFAMRKEECYE